MELVNSYKVKIVNSNKIFNETISIYRNALAYIIDIVNLEFDSIKNLQLKEKNNFMEKLIHKTSTNSYPKYDFDKRFPKFPSYFRRTVLQDAIGIVSSYKSNLENYENRKYHYISNGKKFKEKKPILNKKHFKFPALYKGNMFNFISDNKVQVKIFKNNDWVWLTINLRNQDVKYINKNFANKKGLSPILEKSGRNYYLRFSFKDNVKLKNNKLKDKLVMGVDLGINHSAVCSIINYEGTVLKRKFINQAREKDLQNHLIKRIIKKQKHNRNNTYKSLWNKINNLNTQIINNTVNEIVNFAKENNVDHIVFEYLDFKGKRKGQLKLKMLMWAKRTIFNKVLHKAHLYGIRVNRTSAKNTSKLAFDGSGIVKRNNTNFKLCTFKNGKQYNCDLNASYNIGARFIIGEIFKTLSESKKSLLEAKVPLVKWRTTCTLSTLREIVNL